LLDSARAEETMTGDQHRLQPGDEQLEWATYSELWEREQLTRGALDVLVLNGEVKWVTGEKLLEFIEHHAPHVIEAAQRLGARQPYVPQQLYYCVEGFMREFRAKDAATRLGGAPEQRQVLTRLNGTVKVFGYEPDPPKVSPWRRRR
jgi:hypothetical protein